jgi:xylulokinase
VSFLPHLTGAGTPWLDPNALGALSGIDLSTNRYDILNAAVRGIGYDLFLNLSGFENAGIRIEEIRVSGGGAKSAAWVQLKADITGRKTTVVKESEASSLGAAVCAATGIGRFSSIAEGAGQMVELGDVFEPNAVQHERHRFEAERHLVLYGAIAGCRQRQEGSTGRDQTEKRLENFLDVAALSPNGGGQQ